MAFPDPINTVITKDILPGVTDNVFRNSPLLAYLRKNNLRLFDGFQWQENFLFDTLQPVAYLPGETFDIANQQVATGTTVTPRYYAVPVSALLEKIQVEMAGERAVFDYLDLQLQSAALALSAQLSNDGYRHGQNLSGSDRSRNMNGLDEALNDGVVNGFDGRTYPTYLGITRTEVNSVLNSPMTNPPASVGGAITYPILEEAYSSITIGPEMPDMILTTNRGLSFIKMVFQPQQRFESVDPDTGFRTLSFNGAKVIADQYAPGTRTATAADAKVGYSTVAAGETIWFLNTKYLRLYVARAPLFSFGFTGFMPAQDNSTVAGRYHVSINMTCTAPRLQKLMYAVTA